MHQFYLTFQSFWEKELFLKYYEAIHQEFWTWQKTKQKPASKWPLKVYYQMVMWLWQWKRLKKRKQGKSKITFTALHEKHLFKLFCMLFQWNGTIFWPLLYIHMTFKSCILNQWQSCKCAYGVGIYTTGYGYRLLCVQIEYMCTTVTYTHLPFFNVFYLRCRSSKMLFYNIWHISHNVLVSTF